MFRLTLSGAMMGTLAGYLLSDAFDRLHRQELGLAGAIIGAMLVLGHYGPVLAGDLIQSQPQHL